MKNTLRTILLLSAAFMLPTAAAHAASYTSKVYKDTNGDRQVVGSGGTLKVLSGGTVTVDSGATVNQSGTFKINGNTITATTGTATVTIPNSTDTLVNLAGSQTLTNKTLTTPIIASISNTGTVTLPTATTTLVGTGTTDTLTNKTLSGAIVSDTAYVTSQFDAVTGTTGSTLTNLTGASVTVVPGTYRFYINAPGVATANSGIKLAFKYTTTALTSIEATSRIFTATGVAVQHTTTTTDQTSLAASTTAAISTIIEGRMVVSTGGTVQLQAAQNAAHTDTTSVYAGASMTFTRTN